MNSIIEAQVEFKNECRLLRSEILAILIEYGKQCRAISDFKKEEAYYKIYMKVGRLPDDQLKNYSHYDYRT